MSSEQCELEKSISENRKQLTELKNQFFKHEQALMNWKGKFNPACITTKIDDSLYVKQLAENHLHYIQFSNQLTSALFDLEDWEYCWLTVLQPVQSGAVQQLQLEVTERLGYNYHTQALESLYQNPFIAIGEVKQVNFNEQQFNISLIQRKILKVDIKLARIYFTEKIESNLVIIDFKVYHPMIESVSNLEKKQ
ncbi:hypothetical protein SS50377_24335 [Spironucleus salmonicida]|uniref:Uncharacterized protein n=1 Tax=Spironucleus salmonicida TaxID=348837 RepID=V6LPE3_9EUKA|nr:hypothetical protein SS50377_24335 [Spironucleus salmonicida]|eukprot:EST46113.1 hypothetical protein SS50377_14107 [Spironucleus salmonicida]